MSSLLWILARAKHKCKWWRLRPLRLVGLTYEFSSAVLRIKAELEKMASDRVK